MKTITLGQSTIYMTLASVGQKLISFVYFAIIARTIGAEDTGKYFFALSFTTIFVVFVDLGLTNVMVREGAKSKEKISEFVSSVIFLKIFLGVASYVVMASVLLLLGYEADTQTLVFISGVTMLFDSLQLTLYGTLRALGNITYEACGIVGSQLLTLVLGTLFIYTKLPLYFLMVAFLIPSFLNTLFAWIITSTRYHVRLRPRYSKAIIYYIFPIAIPFALATIFGRIFSYADSVLLSKIAGPTAVGWYSVPYKIAYAFQFIPFALIAGLYPRMSEYFAHNTKRLEEVFSQGLRYLLIVSVPLSTGIAMLARPIIQTFFGREYIPSILPLQVLMLGVVASFVNVILGALLNATGRQKIQTAFVGTAMTVNIILNLILIPKFGVFGAAFSATVGNIVLCGISWWVAHRIVRINYQELANTIIKLGCAVFGMSLFLWYTRGYLILWSQVIIGALLFSSIFVLLKGFSKEDILYFKSLKQKDSN